MTRIQVEILVEEPSMEEFLNAWLPRKFPNCDFNIHPFRGKQAMLRKIEGRLKGYAKRASDWDHIVIIVDLDNCKCKDLKSKLERICTNAGLRSRRVAGPLNWQVVTRIAIEELEAWYFGDWQAVQKAYEKVSLNIPNKSGYRKPDAIKRTWERFEGILQKKGYFRQGLKKLDAARCIGQHIDPARNTSPSFKAFHEAIAEICQSSISKSNPPVA